MSDKLDKIKGSMTELQSYIKKAQEQKSQLAMYNSILTVAIVLTLLIFIYASYATVTSNFSADKVVKALGEYSPKILPEISSTMTEVMTSVAPKYSGLIQEKAVLNMPRIADATDKELITLSDNISKRATERINKTLINVIETQKQTIAKGFNGVEQQKLDETMVQMENDLSQDFTEVCTFMIDKTINEFISLKKTIDSFQDKSLTNDKTELSILMLHNLILLTDHEMMENLKTLSKKGGKK